MASATSILPSREEALEDGAIEFGVWSDGAECGGRDAYLALAGSC
ncbi:uncharacterized protein G2W53_038826 [Senna tora]|uniref:Uncharacterized protein n=1 Tax=Senna tora TaxID=362788 RepID=A0A834SLG9_9FABA|nr:uncharacterized protein G2W53_038826 [Senna tora]